MVLGSASTSVMSKPILGISECVYSILNDRTVDFNDRCQWTIKYK